MESTEIFARKKDFSGLRAIPQYGGDKDFSFTIHALEDAEDQDHPPDIPHRHSYFEMSWIMKGNGMYSIDLDRHLIKNDTLYLIPPGHIHALQTKENARGFMISFSKEFFHLAAGALGESFYHDILMDGSNSFGIKNQYEREDLENILFSMLKEFRNYSLLRTEILGGWLRIFLSYLKGFSKVSTVKPDNKKNLALLNKFHTSLEKNFLQKKMVSDYAGELFISPNYLNEIVKRISGFTVSHHIQQRIVLEAKRLAIYSGSSMKEIAYLLGFEDIAYFSKYFKTFSGTNFRDFKRSQSFFDRAG
jgi:AraC family transcriptional activator of pobA